MRNYIADTPRKVDELVLDAIKLRQRGFKNRIIAHRLGMSPAYVSVVTNRARSADERECKYWGENPKEIMGAYW